MTDNHANNAGGNKRVLRRLLGLAWEYRASCLGILALQLCLLALGLIGLGLTGLAIDVIRHAVDPQVAAPRWPAGVSAAGLSPMRQILVIAAAILGCALARSLLNYQSGWLIGRLVHTRIVFNLRAQVYEKLQRLSFRFFSRNTSGAIISRVTGDVQATRAFIDEVLIQSTIMFISLAAYIVYMVRIHPMLTLACLGSTPALWAISIAFSRRSRPAYAENRRLHDEIVLNFSETILGILAVKGFGREREAYGRFMERNGAALRQHRQIFWMVSLFSPATGFITKANLLVLLAYGGALVFQGELELGSGLVVFATLLQQFSMQVGNLANIANSVQLSLTGARRVFEILDAPVEVQSQPGAHRLDRLEGRVSFERVSFRYEAGPPALMDVSFEARPGERIGIAGATGAGKSALASLIPRFYDAAEGRVLIDGRDIRTVDLADLRCGIGIVFQESFLFSNTVAANIAFGQPHATRQQVERAARLACAHEFIERMPRGYDTVLGEAGKTLSGGQRQRLAIARALLLEPRIFILDDPTAALDAETEAEVLDAIGQAARGRTTFIVTNRLSALRRTDRVLVLDHGRLAQSGPLDALLAQEGILRSMTSLPFAESEAERAALLEALQGEPAHE